MNLSCPSCNSSGYDPVRYGYSPDGEEMEPWPCELCEGRGSLPIDWLPPGLCPRCATTSVAQADGDNVCNQCGLLAEGRKNG